MATEHLSGGAVVPCPPCTFTRELIRNLQTMPPPADLAVSEKWSNERLGIVSDLQQVNGFR